MLSCGAGGERRAGAWTPPRRRQTTLVKERGRGSHSHSDDLRSDSGLSPKKGELKTCDSNHYCTLLALEKAFGVKRGAAPIPGAFAANGLRSLACAVTKLRFRGNGLRYNQVEIWIGF